MTEPPRRGVVRRLTRDGTPYILAGTVVASVAAYLFQVVGGRALGPVAFDPVSALLTVHFLVFTVLLLPIEQFEIRRLTLRRQGGATAVAAVIAVGGVGAMVFTFLTRDRFFDGQVWFAVIGLCAVLSNALFAVARGRLAGGRRFRSYGLVSALAALLRLGLAAVFLSMSAGAVGMGWALVLGPLIVLFWVPLRRTATPTTDREAAVGRFLGGFVLASAASQVLLLAAPLVVALFDDAPGVISVVFVTFQLFRAPIVLTQNLLARLLPPFTTLAAGGHDVDLRRWATRFGFAAIVLGPLAALVGAVAGPPVVAAFFGARFEPGAALAALAASGMVLASLSLLAGQVLVARGRTMVLAVAWLAGFAVAAVALLFDAGSADVRVAQAFVAGEAAAFTAIVVAAMQGRVAVAPR